MNSLSKRLDLLLIELAWSLWTELGVYGVVRKHQRVLILLEELILLTTVLSETDHRLRDESLDWCTQYHHYVSISRLKTILKDFDTLLSEPFSTYAATLNSVSRTSWPVPVRANPLKFTPSGKSCLRPLESPALLSIRARSVFGPCARADLVTFFLTHNNGNYSASDLEEIGYTKRNLLEILEQFSLSGLFHQSQVRNQHRYSLGKNDLLINLLNPVPDFAPSWRLVFEIILKLRDCIKRHEKSSESVQVVEVRNLIITLQKNLEALNLTPPAFQPNLHLYWDSFSNWLLETVGKLAKGDFSDKTFLSLH